MDNNDITDLERLLANLRFGMTGLSPCPYLPDRLSQKLVIELPKDQDFSFAVNSALSLRGYRRIDNMAYIPYCPTCQACLSVRIPVKEFTPNATQRRLQKRLVDYDIDLSEGMVSSDDFALFQAYQFMRHADSEMATMGDYEIGDTLQGKAGITENLRLYRKADGVLCGGMVVDRLIDGLSAVYSYYDPKDTKSSLGTLLILALIAQAKQRELPYIYLGYWVENSKKMDYKKNFRPLEYYHRGWRRLPPE